MTGLHALLLAVKIGAPIPDQEAETLHGSGLITGNQTDAAGLVLTPEGRLALQAFEDVERAGVAVRMIEQALHPREKTPITSRAILDSLQCPDCGTLHAAGGPCKWVSSFDTRNLPEG